MSHRANDKVDAGLDRVSTAATSTPALTSARTPNIDDPMAIKLVESIDFDFEKFGRKGQEMALRSLAVDQCAIKYLTKHPTATVVALAEGLQTSFWRRTAHCHTPNFIGYQ